MKKGVKLTLIVLGSLFGLLLAAVIIVPIVFKPQIKEAIDKTLDQNLNATVYFDADKLGVSLFRNFPNLTVSLADFGVVGKGEFKHDTLAAVKEFSVSLDIMSVISGDMKIKGIYLGDAKVLAKINKAGRANWDITLPDTTTTSTPTDTAASTFKLGIEKWELNNATIVYIDETMNLRTKAKGVDHVGSGNLMSDIFDMKSKTVVDTITVDFDGIKYLNRDRLEADITLGMDMKNMKYTFKENSLKVNEFVMGFDGWLAMPDTNIDMDITYKAKETTFRNILSLVPAVFLSDFDKMKTEGNMAFDGFVKGRFNTVSMPGFGVNLKIDNGMFQYPDLPTAVKNINADMSVACVDGVLDNMEINIRKFHMDLGQNPIDIKLLMKGLTKYDLDADVKAKLNLADLTAMFPIEGTTLKGIFDLQVLAKGVYDGVNMPSVTALMALSQGYVKSTDFPAAMESMGFSCKVQNPTGKMPDTKVWVDNFKMVLDGEPFEGKLYMENLDNMSWDLSAKGIIDLGKWMKLFPIEGMDMSGRITVHDFATKGNMKDLEASNYGQMPTSGDMEFKDFKFSSTDLPQGFGMSTARMDFTPSKINITAMKGNLGKSDLDVSGYVSNYMEYMFMPEGKIAGKMQFNSKKFDVNEWMVEDPNAVTATPTEEVPMTVFEVPKNVDFELNSVIGEVLYSNMDMTNLTGQILVKDGAVKMNNVLFDLLGGKFKTNGTYDTKDIKHPLFDFDLDIKNLEMKKAYATFNTVKTLAPVAKNIDGFFNTVFKIKGELGQDMMPLYNTVSGNGVITIADATLKDVKMMQAVAAATKTKDMSTIKLQNVTVKASIMNGRVYVEPFDIVSGSNKMNIQGSQGIDGTLDYLMDMDMDAGAAGAMFNQTVSNLTGGSNTSSRVKFGLKVGGTSADPKVMVVSAGGGSTVKDEVKNQVTTTVTDKANEELEKQKQEMERLKKEQEEKMKQELERQKQLLLQQQQQQQEQLKNQTQDKLNDIKKNIPFK